MRMIRDRGEGRAPRMSKTCPAAAGRAMAQGAMSAVPAAHDPHAPAQPGSGAPDNRRSGRRLRARDRLMDRATREYPKNMALAGVRDVETLMLFIDDDLRETALALSQIEQYLVRTLALLERPAVDRADVKALASDQEVLDQLDVLNETLESMRRRMAKLAARLR